MEPIRSLIPAPVQAPLPRPVAHGESAPVLPIKPDHASVVSGNESTAVADSQQRRHSAVVKAAGEIANSKVLGTTTFVVFRDATGQYVTRFRGSDGKVVYIPEPEMLRRARASEPTVTLNV